MLALIAMVASGVSVTFAHTAYAAQGLGKGAVFTVGGNKYKVTDVDADKGDRSEVMLVKYGSSKKKPVVNTVKYKGLTYEVETIGKNAFNNAKGHKITAVTLGKEVDRIKAYAFKGCSKLKSINMKRCDAIEIEKEGGVLSIDEVNIGSRAFSGAGVAKVKVSCGKGNASYKALFKKALVKKGLRSDAAIVK